MAISTRQIGELRVKKGQNRAVFPAPSRTAFSRRRQRPIKPFQQEIYRQRALQNSGRTEVRISAANIPPSRAIHTKRAINRLNNRFLFGQEVKILRKTIISTPDRTTQRAVCLSCNFPLGRSQAFRRQRRTFSPATALARNIATSHFPNYPGNYSEALCFRLRGVRPHFHHSAD